MEILQAFSVSLIRQQLSFWRHTRGVSAMLKYKFWPITDAVIETQVMLIVAMETTCMQMGT